MTSAMLNTHHHLLWFKKEGLMHLEGPLGLYAILRRRMKRYVALAVLGLTWLLGQRVWQKVVEWAERHR